MEGMERETLLQDIAGRLVERDIYQCHNSLMDTLLKQSWDTKEPLVSWDDVENVYDDEDEPQEIYEWWCCSDWLAHHLAKRGHPVIRLSGVGISGTDKILVKIGHKDGVFTITSCPVINPQASIL